MNHSSPAVRATALIHFTAAKQLADFAFLEFAHVDLDVAGEKVARGVDDVLVGMLVSVDELSDEQRVTNDEEREFYRTVALRGFQVRWAELCNSVVPGGRA